MADLAPTVVDTVMRVIAEIDPDHLDDREVIAFLAGISETTTGLLQAKPDLKAHADLVMDLANRVFHANKAAEARGVNDALDRLTRKAYDANRAAGWLLDLVIEVRDELAEGWDRRSGEAPDVRR